MLKQLLWKISHLREMTYRTCCFNIVKSVFNSRNFLTECELENETVGSVHETWDFSEIRKKPEKIMNM